MDTTLKFFTLIAIALTLFSSCYDRILIEGNDQLTEETRQLPSFDQVYSAGSFNVFYSHGDSTNVKIVCESNLLPYLETSVFNKKLEVRFATHVSVSLHKAIEIYVTSPEVEKITLNGSGNIVADSISGNNVKIEISGSGNIYSNFYGGTFESVVSGSGKMEIFADCDTLKTTISGVGTVELEAPECIYTRISISGSGHAELNGKSDKAKYIVSGSGKIKALEFQVKEADVTISGSGDAYINVSGLLDAVISGSGNIHYIGTPKINFNSSGSGNLINDN
jgi:hypothetical protein